jgi:hypothetical protein
LTVQAKPFNLQHAKLIFNKVELHCKADVINATAKLFNTGSGIAVNMSLDINQELDNISV